MYDKHFYLILVATFAENLILQYLFIINNIISNDLFNLHKLHHTYSIIQLTNKLTILHINQQILNLFVNINCI